MIWLVQASSRPLLSACPRRLTASASFVDYYRYWSSAMPEIGRATDAAQARSADIEQLAGAQAKFHVDLSAAIASCRPVDGTAGRQAGLISSIRNAAARSPAGRVGVLSSEANGPVDVAIADRDRLGFPSAERAAGGAERDDEIGQRLPRLRSQDSLVPRRTPASTGPTPVISGEKFLQMRPVFGLRRRKGRPAAERNLPVMNPIPLAAEEKARRAHRVPALRYGSGRSSLEKPI